MSRLLIRSSPDLASVSTPRKTAVDLALRVLAIGDLTIDCKININSTVVIS